MGIVREADGRFAVGNVSNPSGINQWTRRREVEQLWLRLLDEVDVERGRSRIETILDRLIAEAEAGRSWAMGMVLDRVLPPIRRDEIEVGAQSVAGPHLAPFTTEVEIKDHAVEELSKRLSALAERHPHHERSSLDKGCDSTRVLIDERGSV